MSYAASLHSLGYLQSSTELYLEFSVYSFGKESDGHALSLESFQDLEFSEIFQDYLRFQFQQYSHLLLHSGYLRTFSFLLLQEHILLQLSNHKTYNTKQSFSFAYRQRGFAHPQ